MPSKTKAAQGKQTITAKGKVIGRPAGKGRLKLPPKSPELKKAPKPEPGRPEIYNKLHDERVFRLALMGATDEFIAEAFQINVDTVHQWKHDHPSFSESIRKAKFEADGVVVQALYRRAKGFVEPVEVISVSFGQVTKVATEKHHPPDTAAAFIWLKNRQPEAWRDKREIGFTNKDGEDLNLFELPKNGRNDLGIETKSESDTKD